VSVYGSLEYTEPWSELKNILVDNWDEITQISTTGKPLRYLNGEPMIILIGEIKDSGLLMLYIHLQAELFIQKKSKRLVTGMKPGRKIMI